MFISNKISHVCVLLSVSPMPTPRGRFFWRSQLCPAVSVRHLMRLVLIPAGGFAWTARRAHVQRDAVLTIEQDEDRVGTTGSSRRDAELRRESLGDQDGWWVSSEFMTSLRSRPLRIGVWSHDETGPTCGPPYPDTGKVPPKLGTPFPRPGSRLQMRMRAGRER